MPIISMRGVIPAIFARSPRGWADDLAPQRLQHGQAAWRHAPLAPSILDAPNEKGPDPKSDPQLRQPHGWRQDYAPGISETFTLMPRPIVEETATLRTYLPFAPDGLALIR